jgi:hypothetical protein
VTLLQALRDALARIQRATEALRDGDREFADWILDDLITDISKVLEREELR